MENLQACGMMGDPTIRLCEPLERLKKEHGPLRTQMDKIYAKSLEIEEGDLETGRLIDCMFELREKVVQFVNELEPHSEREEGVLFPMMTNYIGKETGPIAVMEYEHEQAKAHLNLFLKETEGIRPTLTHQNWIQMLNLYNKAYHILKEHFMKEEQILFPMAERLLNTEEKNSLLAKIESI
ncbi:hemerythrin domain-containing protein [Halalkalibacter urbisdiaboli]|uniref:hemerythrin domain-containing protein n=1 Tax=Halalkalibacter urbisdiaboli TaxID=1960589 RepID=UPI000B454315|nr:hemerythrin domain-containing protein [Halalkalibacter urbisdiaboli]